MELDMSLEGLKTYSDHLMGYTVYMTDGKRQCPAFAQLPQSCLLAMVWIRNKPVCIYATLQTHLHHRRAQQLYIAACELP